MISWKAAYWGGIAGFALSFLVGLVGGVPFGSILLRALIWGILFGALAALAYYVLSRFVPELASLVGGKAEQKSPGAVDIVLPGENPHERGAEPGAFAEGAPGDEDYAPGGAGEATMVEEVEELPPAEAAADGKEAADEGFFSDIRDDAGSDRLPEFDDDALKPRSGGLSALGGASAQKAGGILGGATDARDVARAIRTVLKRDQKG